jgi:hypothetical protein
MNMQRRRPTFLSLMLMGVAVILFSTAGIAAMKGWRTALATGSGDTAAPLKVADAVGADAVTADTTQRRAKAKARANGRCVECGVIVSTWEIEARDDDFGGESVNDLAAGYRDETRIKSAMRYGIRVRMADGSSRVVNYANPTSWRTGERVIIINGTNPSRR